MEYPAGLYHCLAKLASLFSFPYPGFSFSHSLF